jgi:hypothetical protein
VVGLLIELAGVVGTILLAVLAVVWPDQLKDLRAGTWSEEADAFLFLAAFTTVASISAIVRRSIAEDRAKEARALERKVRAMSDALPRLLEGYRTEHPDAAVRLVLRAIIESVWLFDGKPKGARYGANVMVFAIDEPRPAIFVDPSVPTRGFLVLHKSLSTAFPGVEGAPDPTITELVLPVPDAGAQCLPGAPIAFRENSTDFYPDTTKLAKWCAARRFAQHVPVQINEYFSGDGVLVRSMLSVALPGGMVDPFAVLNLHRHKRGMLDGGRSASELVDIAEPLIRLLAQEVAGWREKAQTRLI